MGGDTAVRQLAEVFYDIIEEESPELRAMLPKNTATSRIKLYEFLSGWTGISARSAARPRGGRRTA